PARRSAPCPLLSRSRTLRHPPPSPLFPYTTLFRSFPPARRPGGNLPSAPLVGGDAAAVALCPLSGHFSRRRRFSFLDPRHPARRPVQIGGVSPSDHALCGDHRPFFGGNADLGPGSRRSLCASRGAHGIPFAEEE